MNVKSHLIMNLVKKSFNWRGDYFDLIQLVDVKRSTTEENSKITKMSVLTTNYILPNLLWILNGSWEPLRWFAKSKEKCERAA